MVYQDGGMRMEKKILKFHSKKKRFMDWKFGGIWMVKFILKLYIRMISNVVQKYISIIETFLLILRYIKKYKFMTLKELSTHYKIDKYNNGYLLFSKEDGSGKRIVHKYLCELKEGKTKGSFYVGNNISTKKIEDIVDQVDNFIKNLPYDSEYYLPLYRNGTFEEHIIHDYLSDLGFKSDGGIFGTSCYKLVKKNVYGGNGVDVTFMIDGISSFDEEIPKNTKIAITTNTYSYVSITTNRDVESIKKAIDSLLKPLMISNSIESFVIADKLKNNTDIDIQLNKLTNDLNIQSTSYKEELKKKMQEIIETL